MDDVGGHQQASRPRPARAGSAYQARHTAPITRAAIGIYLRSPDRISTLPAANDATYRRLVKWMFQKVRHQSEPVLVLCPSLLTHISGRSDRGVTIRECPPMDAQKVLVTGDTAGITTGRADSTFE